MFVAPLVIGAAVGIGIYFGKNAKIFILIFKN